MTFLLSRFGSLGGKIYAGGVGGQDYVQVQQATATDGWSTSISHPAPGYRGTLWIMLAGTASKVGNYYGPDTKGGPQASGESAYLQYTCLGDETSFTLAQTGIDTYTSYLTFTVNGGVNNGDILRVGSGHTSGGYGAAGAPWARNSGGGAYGNDERTLSGTLVQSGACRSYNSDVSYSDSTTYSPANNGTYNTGGTTELSWTLTNSKVLKFRGAAAVAANDHGGIVYDGTKYGVSVVTTPTAVTSGNSLTRPTGSLGGVVLVWKND